MHLCRSAAAAGAVHPGEDDAAAAGHVSMGDHRGRLRRAKEAADVADLFGRATKIVNRPDGAVLEVTLDDVRDG